MLNLRRLSNSLPLLRSSIKTIVKTSTTIALVTGASGFIGGHLIEFLVDRGWEVHVLMRPSSKMDPAWIARGVLPHYFDGNYGQMRHALTNSKPSVVFHLASKFLATHSSFDIQDLIQSNILFGTYLLEAMNEANVKNLVNVGTSWQNYEGNKYSPVNLYAATKQAFEAIIQYYSDAKKIKVITMKLSDTYGPSDNRKKLLNYLRDQIHCGNSLEMSPGYQRLDLVHISDVLEALLIAAQRLITNQAIGGEVYSVTGGKPVQIRELIGLIEGVLNRPITVNWGGRSYREREVMEPWVGERINGWTPKVDLITGLNEFFSAPDDFIRST